MTEGDEERSKREKQEQKWKEDDERSARLLADIQALLKRVQERVRRKENGDAGADA
jgi:hypothetical protein